MAGTPVFDGLQHRKAERERLARAGLGLAARVASGERVGNRRGLNGKGFVDALGREGVDELGPEAEFAEGGHVAPLSVFFTSSGGRSSAAPEWKTGEVRPQGSEAGEP